MTTLSRLLLLLAQSSLISAACSTGQVDYGMGCMTGIEYPSTDTPMEVFDFSDGPFTTLSAVSNVAPISSTSYLVVKFDLSHTCISDLNINLVNANDEQILLFSGGCGSDGCVEDLKAVYLDSATASPDADCTLTGTYQYYDPVGGSLASFVPTEGTTSFALAFTDGASGDSGFLNSWSLFVITPCSAGQVDYGEGCMTGVEYQSTDVPKQIDDALFDQGSIPVVTLSILEGVAPFTSDCYLAVKLDVTHDYVSDLSITLVGQDESSVLLINRVCGNPIDDLQAVFLDSATAIPEDDCSTTGGYLLYRPAEGALADLIANGQETSTWTLAITDWVFPDNYLGTLHSWSLFVICPSSPSPSAQPATASSPSPQVAEAPPASSGSSAGLYGLFALFVLPVLGVAAIAAFGIYYVGQSAAGAAVEAVEPLPNAAQYVPIQYTPVSYIPQPYPTGPYLPAAY